MGMLNFSQMLITKAFWGKCIDLFVKWVGNYGWAIILLTIAIKLVLMPIDILQKRTNAKNAKMQAIMQPELQKVQQQFPGNRNKLNQKQMELAKKYNFKFVPLQNVFEKACELVEEPHWTLEGVHPSVFGHRLIANEWLKAFEEIK